MSLNAAAAYGIFPQTIGLNDVMKTLSHAGFDKESICMMLPPTHPIAGIVREAGAHISERERMPLPPACLAGFRSSERW